MTEAAKFAVAVIVLRRNSAVEGGWECVLVARKDDHTRWSLPGGKVDPGETSPESAIRELNEETSINPLFLPQGTVLDSGGYFTTFYLLDTTGMGLPDTFTVADREAPVEWGPLHKLLEGPFGRENAERLKKIGLMP